jgi:hypothetical protein
VSGEDRLRDALADLAPGAPADDRAFAGVQRAVTRRRRHRAVARAAAVVVALGVAAGGALAVAAGGPGAPDASTPAEQADGPAGRSTTSATAPSTTTAAPLAAGATAGRVSFANAEFSLPAGWVVVDDTTDHSTTPARREMCVAPAGNTGPRFGDCAGIVLYHGDLPGYEGGAYTDHGPWQFAHGTDPTPCPTQPAGGAKPSDDVLEPGQAGNDPIDSGFRAVGDRNAVYDQWFARCSVSFTTYTPRAWHLPESRIVILDVVGRPETGAILASFIFSG